MTGTPPITDVTGGSHGLTVGYAHALALADDYDDAGNRMRDWAARSGRVLIDVDLVESAVLSPMTFAEAEGAVLAATSGPHGVLVASVVWETDAVTIRAAVRATQLTDELVALAWERLDHDIGYTIGYVATSFGPELVVPAGVTGLVLYVIWSQLPDDVRHDVQDKSLTELQEWLD